uniref:Uncharacterized protein LOC100377107 n=1 Tax=Saccoglossus kowalevskii TaxID=10224 RepID=A0ABM0GJU4_SACKO|nr:PREDICTED: uncharacterized protein LOC100377107 [Saccoglossus kowalevskii]
MVRQSKRVLFNGHSSPTKTTPEKPAKKNSRTYDGLEVLKPVRRGPKPWTKDEENALVEYISLSKLEFEFDEWPYMKGSSKYWCDAAVSVNKVGFGRTEHSFITVLNNHHIINRPTNYIQLSVDAMKTL